MTTAPRYPRDMIGYGPRAPAVQWPGGARVAISLVLNYEEGGENNILHGDDGSEAFLSDIAGAAAWPGRRHWNMESLYDYGARAGFWRLHRLFTDMGIPVTIYGVTSALARNPEQVAAMQSAGWEIASHGLKWVEHRDMPEEEERRPHSAGRRAAAPTGRRPPRARCPDLFDDVFELFCGRQLKPFLFYPGLGDFSGGVFVDHSQFAGDYLCKRGFSKAGGAVKQRVVHRLGALLGGLDKHRHIGTRRLLADEFLKAGGPQRAVRIGGAQFGAQIRIGLAHDFTCGASRRRAARISAAEP